MRHVRLLEYCQSYVHKATISKIWSSQRRLPTEDGDAAEKRIRGLILEVGLEDTEISTVLQEKGCVRLGSRLSDVFVLSVEVKPRRRCRLLNPVLAAAVVTHYPCKWQ